MEPSTIASRRALRADLALSILVLIFALLFCVIFVVFLTSFGGEFLIVIKGLWILPVFLVLLVGSAIGALVLSARSLRSGTVQEIPSQGTWSPRSKTAWLLGWSVWNLIAILPILLVGKVLALGALGSVPTVVIGLLTLPFVGTAIVFLVGSLWTLVGLARRMSRVRLPRGAAGTGFAFLFAFAAFGVVSALWNPQWTEGVEHMALFSPGDEPGRGQALGQPGQVRPLQGEAQGAHANEDGRRGEEGRTRHPVAHGMDRQECVPITPHHLDPDQAQSVRAAAVGTFRRNPVDPRQIQLIDQQQEETQGLDGPVQVGVSQGDQAFVWHGDSSNWILALAATASGASEGVSI